MQGLVLMYRVRRQIRVSYLFVTCLFRPLRVLARVGIRYKYVVQHCGKSVTVRSLWIRRL